MFSSATHRWWYCWMEKDEAEAIEKLFEHLSFAYQLQTETMLVLHSNLNIRFCHPQFQNNIEGKKMKKKLWYGLGWNCHEVRLEMEMWR